MVDAGMAYTTRIMGRILKDEGKGGRRGNGWMTRIGLDWIRSIYSDEGFHAKIRIVRI